MGKSIISDEKKCIVCGTTLNIHKHHIFMGNAYRRISEEYGCWCYLCYHHHNGSNDGVHFNRYLDLKLKRLAQERFESVHPEKDFIKIFGRNYK